MATGSLVRLTLLASLVWAGVQADYDADEYSAEYDKYDSEEGSRAEAAPVRSGFVTPLDFSPLFQDGTFGLAPIARQPLAAAPLQAEKKLNSAPLDAAVASSKHALRPRVPASEKIFSPENFGFIPVVSQGWQPAPAKYIHSTKHQRVSNDPGTTHAPIQSGSLTAPPLQYSIQTHHDPVYKVYKPDEDQDDLQGKDILAALKKNPAVASYFTPQSANIEIEHPQHYRNEDSNESAHTQKYRANAYLTGPKASSRTRRNTDGRRKRQRRRRQESSDEEEESPYDYRSDYSIRPKEFDSPRYSSYTDGSKSKDNDEEYNYDYGSDYNNDDYERIKKLSEAQAAEIKQNPENCQAVKRDSMTCMVCKNPKTGGNYESCSYVAEPKSNQYAYSREKKFDSKDAPEESADDKESDAESKPAKLQSDESSNESSDANSSPTPKYRSTYMTPPSSAYGPAKYTAENTSPSHHSYEKSSEDDEDNASRSPYKYSPPPPSRSASYTSDDDEDSEEESSSKKPYDYKAAAPEFYTDNENKKDVEHVLAEFKKKDRSACNKVNKNGMTCYQCIDASGLKHEECMFIQESAPKRSHLAYQELKEFTSKPPTLDLKGHEAAESVIITTATPPVQRSAAYLAVPTPTYGTKLKRKKVASLSSTTTPFKTLPLKALRVNTVKSTTKPTETTGVRVTRSTSDDKEGADRDVVIPDETGLAPPEEFAGEASKGAFWAETQPRYSPTLGVSLPAFMLSPSEHELSFDETVAGN